MNILDIIAKKRDAKELSKEEIKYFVKEYTEGKIQDYQASALIMAIYIKVIIAVGIVYHVKHFSQKLNW